MHSRKSSRLWVDSSTRQNLLAHWQVTLDASSDIKWHQLICQMASNEMKWNVFFTRHQLARSDTYWHITDTSRLPIRCWWPCGPAQKEVSLNNFPSESLKTLRCQDILRLNIFWHKAEAKALKIAETNLSNLDFWFLSLELSSADSPCPVCNNKLANGEWAWLGFLTVDHQILLKNRCPFLQCLHSIISIISDLFFIRQKTSLFAVWLPLEMGNTYEPPMKSGRSTDRNIGRVSAPWAPMPSPPPLESNSSAA